MRTARGSRARGRWASLPLLWALLCGYRQGSGGDGQPRPRVRPVFSSLFHGSGGVFVVGLAQPCSRADPGQAASAWAALVSPTVTKVVCGLWLAHQI